MQSTSERPSEPGSDRTVSQSAVARPPSGSRGQFATLIGVAPAAPIVTGRPPSAPVHPVASGGTSESQDGAHDAPASRMRPRVDPASAQLTLPPASTVTPKHTLDAISFGEAPPGSSTRGRLVAAGLAVVTVCAVAAVGTHLYSRTRSSAHSSAAVQAPASAAPEPPPAPPDPVAPAASANMNLNAAPPEATDTAPAAAGPSSEPASKKHAKPAAHRKHAPSHGAH